MSAFEGPLPSESPANETDIYQPELIARHNKLIFGALFVAGEAIVV